MAVIKLDGGYNALPISYKRGNPIPLDTTSVWYSESELKEYAKNGVTAYVGQVVSLVDAESGIATAFIIVNTDGDLEPIGTTPVGDNSTIEVSEAGEISIKGFVEAQAGAQLTKAADGTLSWVVPSTDTVEGLQTTVETLKETINGTADKDGLVKKVSDNAKAISANAKAIETLNGDATKVGSVAYQIAQIVEENGEGIDTLKEIAAWIAEHPEDAAEYNERITANAEEIAALKRLVGSSDVATEIANKIHEALYVNNVEKYALASSLTELSGTVTTVENDVKSLKEAVASKPLHTHTNSDELNSIKTGDVAKWDKNVTKVNGIIADIAEKPLHTHTNQEVLDTITGAKISAWNAAETNAKGYADRTFATKEQGTIAESALQSVTVLGKVLANDDDHETSLSVTEAQTLLRLKSAAYTEASAYEVAGAAAAVQGETTHTVKEAYDLAAGKATLADIESAITNADHVSRDELSSHTGNGDIHVNADSKQAWDTAARDIATLKGNTSAGIDSKISTAIDAHKTESEKRYDEKYATIVNQESIANRLGAVETQSNVATTDVATLKETTAGHSTGITALQASVETLQTHAQTHALKSDVDTALSKKADLEAYTETAETVKELKTAVDRFFKNTGAAEDAIDTLNDIVAYIESDTTGAANLAASIGALETKVDVVKVSTAISTAVKAEETRALTAEAGLSTRIKDLEENKQNYATVSQVNSAKEAAITAAEADAAAKVKQLANGAVTTNATAIATNKSNIETLTSSKANKTEVYAKTETYTKAEVEALLDAHSAWGSF